MGVILPSEGEGYGLVLIEGALCELPAIGVRSGAIQDFVIHEETGLLVDPGDFVAFAKAMIRIIKDPAWQKAWKERETTSSRTAGPLADQLSAIYREVLLQ